MVPGRREERALPLQFSTGTDMDAMTYSGLNCLRAHPATGWPGAQSPCLEAGDSQEVSEDQE